MTAETIIKGEVTRSRNGRLRYRSRFVVVPKPRDPNRLSEREAKCLAAVAKTTNGETGYGVFFRAVAKKTGLDRSATRRAMRSLARKGFLEYIRGLFDESDGMLVGSGYGLTPAGKTRAEALT